MMSRLGTAGELGWHVIPQSSLNSSKTSHKFSPADYFYLDSYSVSVSFTDVDKHSMLLHAHRLPVIPKLSCRYRWVPVSLGKG